MYPWYWYYPGYLYPMMPYDPFALMNIMMYWMIWPYYYALIFETYKAMIDTWKKAIESLTKSIGPSTTE